MKRTNAWTGLSLAIMALASCLAMSGCGRSRSNLYEHTDYFVEQLDTTYESYGLRGVERKRVTLDGKYGVFPLGRLVDVRIEEAAGDKEYESLKDDLARHYRGDRRVNQVYRNQGGTITIDCRH